MTISNRLTVLAADISAAPREIKATALKMAERAVAVGHMLIEAKETVAHGQWTPWLKEHVGMSDRTAQRYMQLARSGLKTATVADMGIRAASESIAKKTTREVPDDPDASHGWPLPEQGQSVFVEGTGTSWLLYRNANLQPDGRKFYELIGQDQSPYGEFFYTKRGVRAEGLARALKTYGFLIENSEVEMLNTDGEGVFSIMLFFQQEDRRLWMAMAA